jgi:hypothetical protein
MQILGLESVNLGDIKIEHEGEKSENIAPQSFIMH